MVSVVLGGWGGLSTPPPQESVSWLSGLGSRGQAQRILEVKQHGVTFLLAEQIMEASMFLSLMLGLSRQFWVLPLCTHVHTHTHTYTLTRTHTYTHTRAHRQVTSSTAMSPKQCDAPPFKSAVSRPTSEVFSEVRRRRPHRQILAWSLLWPRAHTCVVFPDSSDGAKTDRGLNVTGWSLSFEVGGRPLSALISEQHVR